MEHKKGSKVENFNKVRKAVEECSNTFTLTDIQNTTGLNYIQCKKYLTSMVELGFIKYSDSSKIYMRI